MRVLGIVKMITATKVWTKEVAMAKVIEFYIPQNFQKPMKWVPKPKLGELVDFRPQTKQSA